MQRAGIFIGIDRTGKLPTLKSASKGAERMAEWASKQSIQSNRIKLITDVNKRDVTAIQIKDAIKELTGIAGIQQLIVYFAGHGFYLDRAERWLLSGAPEDSDEVVNLERSKYAAQYGPIDHVVIISDTCRAFPSAISPQLHDLGGQSIFRNSEDRGLVKSVDIFFSCTLGTSSLEVFDSQDESRSRSIYTEVLCDALSGNFPAVLDAEEVEGRSAALVRGRPLKRFLTKTVPERLIALGLAKALHTPDALICSPDSSWISLISPPPAAFLEGQTTPIRSTEDVVEDQRLSEIESVQHAMATALFDITVDPLDNLPRTSLSFSDSIEPADCLPGNLQTISQSVRNIVRSDKSALRKAKSRSALIVKGAQIQSTNTLSKDEIADTESSTTVLFELNAAHSVLVTFQGGSSTVLPIIPDHVTSLVFQQDAIASVSWIPLRGSQNYHNRFAMRAMAASLSLEGVFRFDNAMLNGWDSAERLINQMQYSGEVDLSLALYGAYACYDLQFTDLISRIGRLIRVRLQLDLFDLALLAGPLKHDDETHASRLVIALPLLSRGWSLIPDDRLADSFLKLHKYLMPSQWTLFNRNAAALLSEMFEGRR